MGKPITTTKARSILAEALGVDSEVSMVELCSFFNCIYDDGTERHWEKKPCFNAMINQKSQRPQSSLLDEASGNYAQERFWAVNR